MSRLDVETDTAIERLSPHLEALKEYYDLRTASPPEEVILMMKEMLKILLDLHAGAKTKFPLEIAQWWGTALQELITEVADGHD